MKPKIKVEWSEEELSFLKENFYILTWAQLTESIRKNRPEIEIGAIRHQCIRMGLKKQVQIRWCKDDILFLKENYRSMGDIEISEHLNEAKRTFRIIDGEKVYRTFTKKHVNKKMKLLGLQRTKEERRNIFHRNLKIGKGYSWTKDRNAYTLGIREIAQIGAIRKWYCNGRLRVCVKTSQGFSSYPRKLWVENNGDIPPGYNIIFKDGNPENCILENLECISNAELSSRNGMSDGWIAYCIAGKKHDLRLRHAIRNMPELLELKRQQLLLNKQIKQNGRKNEKA